ncbi:MAG: ABC transporter permease [Gemmataceae bacterium]|nr:ABC transporter permease [Gemmataceae bacterium]
MKAVPIITQKDLRLLVRDTRTTLILLVAPLIFIAILGLVVGDGFGQLADEKPRISIVNLDRGLPPNAGPFPGRPWSEVVIEDFAVTAGLRVELIPTREEAERLVRTSKRPAVLVIEPDFSARVHACSFLAKADMEPINPFYEDGISLEELHVTVLRDPTQTVGAGIIEQVTQVTMLRVIMPWMIGKAFDRVGDKPFMDDFSKVLDEEFKTESALIRSGIGMLKNEKMQQKAGNAVREAIKRLFEKYDLRAKTWPELTKRQPMPRTGNSVGIYGSTGGGLSLNRGSARYQVLVPSYAVLFAFFLVVSAGWLFVGERRQGTLQRLQAAPVTRFDILFGKMLPCLIVSLIQGFLLLIAGNLLFGMKFGDQPLWVIPVVICTSLAATTLAVLVAGIARTEMQVAVYGSLLMLLLAAVSGCVLPRDLMPEAMQYWSHITPHAWALDAYQQILVNPNPSREVIVESCLVLLGFSVGFFLLAWLLVRLK